MPRTKRPANPARSDAGAAQRRRFNGNGGSSSASPAPLSNDARVRVAPPASASAIAGSSASSADALRQGLSGAALSGVPGGVAVYANGTAMPMGGNRVVTSSSPALMGTPSGGTASREPSSGAGGAPGRTTASPSPSHVLPAGGPGRPVLVRPLLSDTPASPSLVGPSSTRPPTPSPSTSAAPSTGGPSRPGLTTLADALAVGMRPLRLHLVAVATSVDSLVDSVRDILVKVEILTRGHERLSMAMQSVQGGVTVGFKDVMDGLERMSVGAEGRVDGARGDVAQTLTIVGRVKAAFREDEKKRILDATRSGEVCINTSRTWQRLVQIVMEVRDVDRPVARDWLLSTIHLPARRDAQVLVGMRACVPILRAKPHLMQTLKDIVCNAFLRGVGLNREDITNDLSRLWMDNDGYMTSELGLPSILGGLADMARFLGGAAQMIEEPVAVGGRPIIHCLLGHFALASCFVRAMLETKAGVRPRRRSGIGNGVFDQWETELCRADAALPQDTEVHNGLRLTDGADPDRGVVVHDDDGESSDADSDSGAVPPGAVEDDDDDGRGNAGGASTADGSASGTAAPAVASDSGYASNSV